MIKAYLTEQADKDLKELPAVDSLRIKKKLVHFSIEAVYGKKLSGKLHGFYSLKVWPYRIIYFFKNKNEAWIVHIKHRKDVYK